jgi:hypothetical protein
MTNEKLVEEIYYDAHARGFINILHDHVDKIYKTKKQISHTDAVFAAYDELIKRGIIQVRV